MARRAMVVWLVGLTLAFVRLAEAQEQAKVPKIGLLGPGSSSDSASSREILLKALHELGYIDGKNITIEYRYADNKVERLPALADELVRLKADVLVTTSTPAAIAAKNSTRTIPLIFLGVSDPVTAGLIDSLARPGGNLTGFTSIAAVLAGKRLELLKETIPKLSRVAHAVESAGPWLPTQLEGKPTAGARIRSAT